MIKCDFRKETRISGSTVQIAAELEKIMRYVRSAFCIAMGEEDGNEFFDRIIENSRKSESDIKREVEALEKEMEVEDPELLKEVNANVNKIWRKFLEVRTNGQSKNDRVIITSDGGAVGIVADVALVLREARKDIAKPTDKHTADTFIKQAVDISVRDLDAEVFRKFFKWTEIICEQTNEDISKWRK